MNPVVKSKTMWFGLGVVILGGVQTMLPGLEEFIKPEVYGPLTSIIGTVIMILRAFTSKPLSEK